MLVGMGGLDVLTGSGGSDRFVFEVTSHSVLALSIHRIGRWEGCVLGVMGRPD